MWDRVECAEAPAALQPGLIHLASEMSRSPQQLAVHGGQEVKEV